MPSSPLLSRAGKLLLAAGLVAGFTAAPITFVKPLGIDGAAALAKGGNGNDHGGGHGGGNGNGGNKDASNSGPGNSAAAPGHNKAEYDTATANDSLGSLNASNASPTARAKAARNSRVGMLDEYEKALAEGDLDAAAAALAGAANKEITPEVVGEVNRNMGIESTPEVEAEVAAKAEAARTAAPDEDETASEDDGDDETVAEEDGGDPTEAEDGEIASAAEDLVSGQ